MEGPYLRPPPVLFVSPLELVEKKKNGKYRLIHDFSYPNSQSVNDQIAKDNESVRYQTLDNATYTILQLGHAVYSENLNFKMHTILSQFIVLKHTSSGLFWEPGY